MTLHFNCSSQDQGKQEKKTDRQPYAAGRFYSQNPEELRADLQQLFQQAIPRKTDHVVAIISPHAGYVFSGEVAASAFNQIDNTKKYDNIFMLASSHVKHFNGASVYYKGDYITPLGTVKVNTRLAKKLVDENKIFTFDAEAHQYEHSLEVQLPFLQYIMKTDFTIIPIVLGSQSPDVCKEIASILKPYLNENNLFIISSDFSHYPDYEDATAVDLATANAILTNSPEQLIKTLNRNTDENIPNLATSMCGWTAGIALLYMTEKKPDIKITAIQYKNSGDASFGDKSRVVGYYALSFSLGNENKQDDSDFILTENDKKDLLEIARETVDKYVRNRKVPDIDPAGFSENLLSHSGAFVTLHKEGKLRGCIGRFKVEEPLYLIVQQMAISSSTQDSRFKPVTPDELDDIELEVSVLSPMRKIDSIDEIILGKHGIYIKKGWSTGTFLPQVASETGWSKEEFLGYCARDKAGIGWDGWKDAEVYIYEALVFSEKNFK
ncbi:MAG: AmmeMemoRadiSam system protein B [Bacteroidales bacterium]|nr:AmmeMemoRadiSam system protein B [Bacteroidales bacterium]